MKASDLILILQNNPDAGYKRTGYQTADSFTVDLEENQIKLNGGKEKRI